MNLVDEQHVPRLEIGQQRRQIAGPLENRAGCLAEIHLELVGDDVRQGGLAEPRGSENQHVIQRLAAHARRLDRDVEQLDDLGLAHVVRDALGSHRAVDFFVLGNRGGGDDSIRFYAHACPYAFAADLRARRMSSVVESPGSSAAFSSRATSGGL